MYLSRHSEASEKRRKVGEAIGFPSLLGEANPTDTDSDSEQRMCYIVHSAVCAVYTVYCTLYRWHCAVYRWHCVCTDGTVCALMALCSVQMALTRWAQRHRLAWRSVCWVGLLQDTGWDTFLPGVTQVIADSDGYIGHSTASILIKIGPYNYTGHQNT